VEGNKYIMTKDNQFLQLLHWQTGKSAMQNIN